MVAHAIEFVLLFVVGPALFAFTRHRIPAIPALWVLTGWCLYVLLNDPSFDRARLWNTAPFLHALPSILALFTLAVGIGVALVLRFKRDLFLGLVRSNPSLWGLLMVAYPVLSVYPQGIVFRAFFFERYHDIFGPRWLLVLASAFAFTWVHVIFRNPIALVLTGFGGLLFAMRYVQTSSLFVTSFEHALYGCAIFTIGVGRSLHHTSNRK
jgi:membrane protease YdiL (CAAX protease family)